MVSLFHASFVIKITLKIYVILLYKITICKSLHISIYHTLYLLDFKTIKLFARITNNNFYTTFNRHFPCNNLYT